MANPPKSECITPTFPNPETTKNLVTIYQNQTVGTISLLCSLYWHSASELNVVENYCLIS